MDTISFPALVVPDVKVETEEMLTNPVNIHLGDDIRNPDLIIDNLIDHLKQKGIDANWLFTIREFTHAEKVQWILSLPDPGRTLVPADSFIFPVTVCSTVMLKVAETVAGESLYEKKEVEKTLEKCLPGQS
jgi:hypothetical protein